MALGPPIFLAPSIRARSLLNMSVSLLVAIAMFFVYARAQAQDLKVRHKAGSAHGFLVVRDQAGSVIASGELTQSLYRDMIKVHVVFRFLDGSLDDETTLYSQTNTLRLVSYHVMQRGKSFPNPCDITIDPEKNLVDIHAQSKGKEVAKTEHTDLPPSLANGIVFVLLENLQPNAPAIELPYLAPSAKPRMVKLSISQEGEDRFKVGGITYKAMKYDIKVLLGGLAGVVAPMIGKQPADLHVWVSKSAVPAILRIDGALYTEGPIWSIRLASPVW